MAKALKAGGEVDSWCTKCKLFLNHRIIAMIGAKPARVECSTCGSHHNYRAASPGEKPETSTRANAKAVSGQVKARTPRGPTKAEQERITRFFHALADEHEAGDFLLGCLVGNLSLELGGSSEPVRTELASILDRWDAALTVCVRSGQRGSGGIRKDLDAGELASRLIEAWEGAALRGKVTRSRIPYDRFEAVTVPALLH